MRREYRKHNHQVGFRQGSSPFARGVLCGIPSILRNQRIIPACAGSTSLCVSTSSFPEDHPRLRGEYCTVNERRNHRIGSPPLARGVPTTAPNKAGGNRITPACAGSTIMSAVFFISRRDHPRLRGEYVLTLVIVKGDVGSSPLARGVQQRRSCWTCDTRIIPACAGSTCRIVDHKLACEDHPRLRGEYRSAHLMRSAQPGSSPLARGVPIDGCNRCIRSRIIPACAGSTLKKACIYVILVFYLSIFPLT